MWSIRKTATVLAICLVPGALTACGRDDGGSASADESSDSKAPVKVLAIAASGSPIQNYPDVEAGGKAAAKAINDAGGINGHPIEFSFCNDQADANKSVACSREAVKEKVAAVVGQVSLFDAQTLPILEAAGIPSVGLMTPGNSVDVTSPASYPFSAGSFADYLVLPAGLKQKGAKRVAVATADLPTALANVDLIEVGAKDSGIEFVGSVPIPPTGVTDYSPYAQKLKQLGADSVVMVTTPAQTQGLIKANESLGLDFKYGHHTISFGESEAKTLSGAAEGMLLSGPNPSYRDTANPAIKEFNAEVKAAGFTKPILYRTAGINAWLSVYGVKAAAEKIDGEINAKSLTEALDGASDIDLKGITTWSPSKKGPTGYERVSGSKMYFQEIKDGKTVDAGVEPVDAMPLLGTAAPSR